MGYYSILMDYKIDNAKISNKDEFLKEVEKECHFGFSPDNCKIEIDESGCIKDFNFEEWNCKFYDDETFMYILSEYLEEGSVYFAFRGEDGEEWCFKVFPDFEIDAEGFEWRERNIEYFIDDLEEVPQQVKEQVLKEYKEYWEEKFKKSQKILEKISSFENKSRDTKPYRVMLPAEEKRLVAINWIKYCDTKEEAQEIVECIKKEKCISEIDWDDWEDVDVIDSWDSEYLYEDVEIEEVR